MRYLDLDELVTELDELRDRKAQSRDLDLTQEERDYARLSEDEQERLAELEQLETDLGETLSAASREGGAIAEEYFTEYAEELAEDMGAISRDAQWPLMHIDWKAAADDLKVDYTAFDFEGVSYLIRL